MTPITLDHATILHLLGDRIDYDTADRSFSPLFSDIGLGFGADPGIARVYLHYNRRVTDLGASLVLVPGALVETTCAPLEVTQTLDSGSLRYIFYARNAWLVEAQGVHHLEFKLPHQSLKQRRVVRDGAVRLYAGYMPNTDLRDPDSFAPVLLGLRVVAGEIAAGDGLNNRLRIIPDEAGCIRVAYALSVLDFDPEALKALLDEATTPEAAYARSLAWFDETVGACQPHAADEAEARVLAASLMTLAFNATRAPGLLAGRVAAFPSRGRYPTHFLWDTCFQNLGLEGMHPQLAPDALLLLTENQRSDGKIPQFICSTWVRPRESQPPLRGWAGWRLAFARADRALAALLLPVLLRNTDWWLIHRMTPRGVIYCPNPLETGWDDTPRMDQGAILPLDMNSYLLSQMHACADLARFVGDDAIAARVDAQAEALAARIVDVFYDPDANLFQDVLLANDEKLMVKTPACFLPLWAGVTLPRSRARAMIEDYLLNPAYFFGPVPFPSLAYDEAGYEPGRWWRGPTWLPVAWLMLELLQRYGYADEWRAAAERLYALAIRDGRVSELFDSQTGEGLGAAQHGWTAAILLRLNRELNGNRC